MIRTSKIDAICLPAIRFSTSGGDLRLLELENENRCTSDSVLPGDVDSEWLTFVDDVIETMDERFSLFNAADVMDVAFVAV